jgi:hypothetical protein
MTPNYESGPKSEWAIMTRDGEEWQRAWAALSRATVNRFVEGDKRAAPCPKTGESWQYMGTSLRDGEWVHDFRHRHHPSHGERLVCRVGASWTP